MREQEGFTTNLDPQEIKARMEREVEQADREAEAAARIHHNTLLEFKDYINRREAMSNMMSGSDMGSLTNPGRAESKPMRDVPEIIRCTDSLDSNLDRLAAMIAELEERLSPVLNQRSGVPEGDASGEECVTSLGIRLSGMRERTDYLIQRVGRIIALLEV